jgi:hypothetical protein
MRKQLDVFPAIVKVISPGALSDLSLANVTGDLPQGTRKLDRCRVAIVNDTILIAVDSPEGPKLVFREKVVEMINEKGLDRVKTESGKMLAFVKDTNCGCGSRLRSWNPFGNVVSSTEDPNGLV